MRNDRLDVAKMRKTIHPGIGRKNRLAGRADAEKVRKLVESLVLGDESETCHPDQHITELQRQKRLNVPGANSNVPDVPSQFVQPQGNRQRPAQAVTGRFGRAAKAQGKRHNENGHHQQGKQVHRPK